MTAKVIRKVGVLGSGVMGGGIAAHMANAGLEVILLDMPPKDAPQGAPKAARNKTADAALAGLLKARPALLFAPANAKNIETGNFDDDLGRMAECDLVIEAIVERLDIKQSMFAKLEAILGAHTIVASNTSGLRIHDMVEGRSKGFKERFLVMHFFNPVRYMKLLELVAGPETDAATVARIAKFGKDQLGKGIVLGKDTPNFVGNRIGVHSMLTTIHEMVKAGLTPEDVDNITGTPMGHPKSASFRTADMVGLDTFVHVADNCVKSLPNDEERAVFEVPSFVRTMVEKKILGDKTKGGFYKKGKEGVDTLDFASMTYRAKGGDPAIAKVTKGLSKIEDPKERVRKLVATEGLVGAFAWTVLSKALAYSARRIGEITDDVAAVDDAMKWGYNWELGPFETWDALGFAETVDRMKKDGIALPASVEAMRASGASGFYRADGAVYDLAQGAYVARPADAREYPVEKARKGAPVYENGGAVAHDLGDGVLGLTFTTKANSIDPDVIQALYDVTAKAEESFRALLVANTGEHFCVGANLFGVVMAAQAQQWDELSKMIRGYQYATQRLKYARVPVVAAPYGMTLGGGLELCFGCDAVQASAETYAGLVEVGVGLIPGAGGCKEMVMRYTADIPADIAFDPNPFIQKAFERIATAQVATSGGEAQAWGFLRPTDKLVLDIDGRLAAAKKLARGLADGGYAAPAMKTAPAAGEACKAAIEAYLYQMQLGGFASAHDAHIGKKLAHVLTGGDVPAGTRRTEQDYLDLEREVFLSLCGEPKTLERIQHMLTAGKPLRN